MYTILLNTILMKSQLELEMVAAKRRWPEAVHTFESEQLKFFITRFGLSVNRGDLQILNGHWYITHTGLLGVAHREHCCGLHTEPIHSFVSVSSRASKIIADLGVAVGHDATSESWPSDNGIRESLHLAAGANASRLSSEVPCTTT